jgi:hypothetical protein
LLLLELNMGHLLSIKAIFVKVLTKRCHEAYSYTG